MKYTVLIFFICFFICFSKPGLAQFEQQIKESLSYKPKPTFRYDSRNSIISTWGARINSIKVGMEFNDIIIFGIGYEWLSSEIIRNKYIQTNKLIADTIDAQLKLNYASVFTEYLFYSDKKWEFALPISIGAGVANYNYEYNNVKFKESRTMVLIYETNMIGHYKIIPWFGIGAGIGYRIMIKGNGMINENFNSPIYILKFKIYFSEIYNDLF